MWISRFFNKVAPAIEAEEKLVINRRTFFFMSAGAAAGALILPKLGLVQAPPLIVGDPILDQINLVTLREIERFAAADNFFLNSPFLAHLRANALVPFDGGLEVRHPSL